MARTAIRPPGSQASLRHSQRGGADRRGGRDAWGLRELLPGRLHHDPGVLLDRLLPLVIELLNELMAATPGFAPA